VNPEALKDGLEREKVMNAVLLMYCQGATIRYCSSFSRPMHKTRRFSPEKVDFATASQDEIRAALL
jgi:hypothetical protein